MTLNRSVITLGLLTALLGGVLYYNTHLENIAALQADYYFKKNDMTKAQTYYERAFQAGLTDSKARDLYVNSIINSPLDIKAQEKLVNFLNYPIEDSAKLKVEYFLYDLKREIYKKYPKNYISQTVFNQKVLRWSNNPITYGFVYENDTPEYFDKEIENAFTEWEKATSHQLLFTKEDKNPNIIIKYGSENPANKDNPKHVVAYTTPIITTGKLKNMVITFYQKDPTGEYYTENQVYNTALHEIVHALGFMGHSYDKENIMYLTKDSQAVAEDLRETLTEADINTVKLLYKIKPEITNLSEPNGEYIPYLVLGNDEEVSYSKTKEAKNYIKKVPTLPGGYIDLAESYVAQKDYPNALKSLEKALRLSDTDDARRIAYYNLAVVYYYLDHTELALENLEKAREIKDSEDIHYLLAELYVKQKNIPDAINEYKFLISKNPSNIEYTIALTNTYVRNRNYLKARSVIKNYIKNNPQERNNPRFNSYGVLKLGL